MNKLKIPTNIKTGLRNKFSLGMLLVVTSLLLTACIPTLNTQQQPSNTTETQPDTSQKDSQQVSGSLLDMLNLNKNMQCSYSDKDAENKTSFTAQMYLAGNKVRSNVEYTDKDNKTTESSMIGDGEWLYIWTNASNNGTKMKIDAMEETLKDVKQDVNEQSNKNADVNQVKEKYDYSCDSWNPDMSMFAVPSTIAFIDLQETMDKLKEQTGGFKDAGCNACKMIQDTGAQAECLQRLDC